MPAFSNSSLKRLNSCHSDLRDLFTEVVKHYDCTVLCGHRDVVAQTEAFDKGHSKVQYPNSRHNSMPSMAIDVVPYPIDWDDKDRFIEFAGFVFGIASQMDINIEWGGHFKSFFDGPHFQINKGNN